MSPFTVSIMSDPGQVNQPGRYRDASTLSPDMLSVSDVDSQPPAGYPRQIHSPMAWTGLEQTTSPVHIVDLDEYDLDEIRRALESFKSLDMNGDEVTRELFSLTRVGVRLREAAVEVHEGSGTCIVRGLDPKQYSIEDNTVIFLGIASYFGDQRGVQNVRGDMLSHVTDSKLWRVPRERRHGIHTNQSLPFHNDMGSDLLAIQVRECAEVLGGQTCIASACMIYNDLVHSKPWVIRTLAEAKWPVQVSYKQKKPYVLAPVLEYHDSRLLMSMDPARIGPHPLKAADGTMPLLTREQMDALDEVQRAARKHQVRLHHQAGDIVFLNNWGVLHARDAYVDGPSTSRHLVRLWLRDSQLGWRVPPSMRSPWDAAFGVQAGLIRNRHYPLAPMPHYMGSKYTNGTAAFVAEAEEVAGVEGGLVPGAAVAVTAPAGGAAGVEAGRKGA